MLSPKISLIPVIFGTMLTVQRKLSCDALIIPDFEIHMKHLKAPLVLFSVGRRGTC